jgi:hypothetical protein
MTKKGAEILFAHGVRTDTILNTSNDFESIQKLKHKLKNTIVHTSISFPYEDSSKLTNAKMEAIGRRFLEKLGLENHQTLCVRHNDSKHFHFHLINNRLGWDGKVYSDSFLKNRAAMACDELEVEFDLTVARGHGQTIKHKWNEKNAVKEEISSAINEGLAKGVSSFKELGLHLKPYGIEMKIQYHKNQQVNGLSFRKGEIALKGSAIDKRFSYKRISKQMAPKAKTTRTQKLVLNTVNKVSHDLQQVYADKDDGVLHIDKIFQLNKSRHYER